MGDGPLNNVIQFPKQREAQPHLACPCGEVWWNAIVVIDAATRRVTGHGLPLECHSCGYEYEEL